MKKPAIIFALCSLLFALSVTLFAQTTTGSSMITEMKAGVRAFTLTADLNPGATGLQSAPLTGKRTGDQLSAAEYNRLLELVGQGGGGGWTNVPLTDTADYDTSCVYRYSVNFLVDDMNRKWMDANSSVGYATGVSNKYLSVQIFNNSLNYGIPSATKSKYGYRSSTTDVFTETTNVAVTKIEKLCGGGGGTGGGQSNIIKGTVSVGFTNGQSHSTMAAVSFGRTCANPVITVQTVADSILCGTSAAAGTCNNAPSTNSQDLSAYFHTVTSTGFQVFLSGMDGVWVGASSPAFYINYIVACD